jgi:CIC family chloride channel protein
LISAGIGSIYATLTRRAEADRRLLVLIGMASGLSAIFRSPIGTAIFAIEVLYGGMEFEAGALIYTMLGSIVAYAVNGLFVGYQPLFHVPNAPPPPLQGYLWYALLGIAAGLIATLLPQVFYKIRDYFAAIPIPPHFKPAIGGLAVGLVALFLPQVLAGGYGYIQIAIDGGLSAGLLLALVFGEIVALSLTISSGGSGGVFAPSLFVGAMLGGFLAKVLHQPAAGLTVVGMMAVFGGAARVPIATLIMVTEMTGDYSLLAPAALSVMLSFLIQNGLSRKLKYKSLYEAQVPLRYSSPAHYVEHLESTLRLLTEQHFLVPATVSHLDLRLLLASGIPVDLPGNKQLIIGVLKGDSSFAGKPVRVFFDQITRDEIELVSIFRAGKTLLPLDDLELKPGDRLLVIASPIGRKQLDGNLSTLEKSQVIYTHDG